MKRLTGITKAAKIASGRSQKCATCPMMKKYKGCNMEILQICAESFQEGFKKGAKFANEKSFDAVEKKAIKLLVDNFGDKLEYRINKLEEEVNELKYAIVDYETYGNNDIQHIIEEIGDVLIVSAHVANLCKTNLHEIMEQTIDKIEKRKLDPNYMRDEAGRNKHNRQNQ